MCFYIFGYPGFEKNLGSIRLAKKLEGTLANIRAEVTWQSIFFASLQQPVLSCRVSYFLMSKLKYCVQNLLMSISVDFLMIKQILRFLD